MSAEPPLSRYLHNKAGALGKPVSGTFELTPRCNFNCKMCYVHLSEAEQRRRGAELTAAQWLSLGEQACREGLVFLLLTGGEPTIRKDFWEIYSGLKRMGLLISINTNGSLLKEDLFEKMIGDPPHRLNISLYGTSSETYEALCGAPAFDTVLGNINALRAAGISIKVSYTMGPANKEDRAAIRALAHSMDLHVQTATYLFPPIRNTGSCEAPNRLPPEEAAKYEAERLREESSPEQMENLRKLLIPPESDRDDCAHCRAGHSNFWIDWDGRFCACCMIPNPSADAVELGFSAAWQQVSRAFQQIRFPAECARCKYQKICHICMAMCYSETLRFDTVPEYPCRMTKALVKELGIE